MVSFNFTFAEGTPIEVMSAFWEAGDAWSTERVDSDILDVVTDDATINIYVDYGALPDAALAGSRPGMTRVEYTDFFNKFNSDSSSPDDQSAASYLEPGSSFEYLRETYNSDTNTWGETSEVDSANTIWLTRSNAKALNLIDGNDGDFDASIRVSNSAPWHFDTEAGVPGDKYDLLTVAKHEISHVLGFISGTDVFDLLAEEGSITDQDLDYVSPMDLLRYSEASSELGVPDWTRGQTYFSLDGGDNNLGDFATGVSNDGFQSSHWQDGDSRGVTSPLLQQGQRVEISDLDLRLLDGVGWDRISQLQADVEETTQTIDWTSSDPDLTPLENLLTGYLDEELARLAAERDAIKELDPELWSELAGKAEEESQKQREAIQITLGKVEENKDDPNKRTEEAIKGASDEQKALADLDKFYFDKLEEPLKGQINDWLDDSPTELKENIENATDLQLFTLATTVSSADDGQRTEWNDDLREALGLLYQETFNGQSPTGTQLDAALAKLLSISSLDEVARRGSRGSGGSRVRNWWQTGESVDAELAELESNAAPDEVARRGSGGSRVRNWWQTGESVDAELAELDSNAAPEQAIYSESSWQSDLASDSPDLDSSSVDITGATTIDNSLFSIPELAGEKETTGVTELNGNFDTYGQGGEFDNWEASTGILEPVWGMDNVESVGDL